MAVYKVPQDVEAEDKLLGPFSFRQFIYLIVAALAIFLAYGLSRAFWALAIIPVPLVVFFLVLALPLKKDQPMETYLTAIVRFLLKPHVRLWDPEGEFELVEITAPLVQDGPELKDFSGEEASRRLRYLSQVVDTGGWATRGLTSSLDNLSLSDTVVAEAQSTEDVFDNSGSVSQNIGSMITESDEARKREMIQTMQATIQATSQPAATPPVAVPVEPAEPVAQTTFSPDPAMHVKYSPYPSAMHQTVIGTTAPSPPPQTAPSEPPSPQPEQPQASSEEPISPDIMRLAASKDLSISTIAREAERLQKKHLQEDEEVVVSLR